jgi:hypothetical protein
MLNGRIYLPAFVVAAVQHRAFVRNFNSASFIVFLLQTLINGFVSNINNEFITSFPVTWDGRITETSGT